MIPFDTVSGTVTQRVCTSSTGTRYKSSTGIWYRNVYRNGVQDVYRKVPYRYLVPCTTIPNWYHLPPFNSTGMGMERYRNVYWAVKGPINLLRLTAPFCHFVYLFLVLITMFKISFYLIFLFLFFVHCVWTCHYGNQSRGYFNGGRPPWPPAVPRLAARPYQSNPRGSGPEVLKRERGHVTVETWSFCGGGL